MKTNKYFIGLIIINIALLIGSIFLGCMATNNTVPHEKISPEEFQTRLQKITNEERLQRLFIADDKDIRALQHLAEVERDIIIFCSFMICLISIGSIVILWKNRNTTSLPRL
jgi:hypothetical protein